MGQELQLPESFRGQVPSQAFAALDAQDDNLAAGIGQSYGVIGYKGKTWSLRYRGDRKNILDPRTGAPSGYLDVIILGQAQQKSKSFYKEYVQGQEGDRPLCASMDGLVPDLDVVAKQSDTCALCPRNEWKTDPTTGRKGRECTDYKRLAVLILPTQTKPLLGEPLIEPVFLRVPPDSLTSLAVMGETMGRSGFHYSAYITRITFDPNKAHPEMVFRPLQGLTDAEAPVILAMRDDPNVGRITGGNVVGSLKAVEQALQPQLQAPGTNALGLGAPATPTASLIAAPATAPVVQPPSAPVVTAPPVALSIVPAATTQHATTPTASLGLGLGIVSGGAQPATPPQNTSAGLQMLATPAPAGGVSTASGTVNQTPTVAPTAGDAGAPEESDADMDARIAKLINAQ